MFVLNNSNHYNFKIPVYTLYIGANRRRELGEGLSPPDKYTVLELRGIKAPPPDILMDLHPRLYSL